MSSDEKKVYVDATATPASRGVVNEKSPLPAYTSSDDDLGVIETDLNATEDDLLDAKEHAKGLDLEQTRELMQKVILIHKDDPNFPSSILDKINYFLDTQDVFDHPENHADLIQEMKMEAALMTTNSPYAEVRAVVDNTDDPSMPSSTIRAWIIGQLLVVGIAFVNQLFTIRQPSISLMANVAQLLCYPIGKAFEALLPDWGFTLFGTRHSLNPGKFNKKEHMLITIMANIGCNTPYTDNIIWAQYLPQYFNQSYAGRFSYQIIIALATNYIGYGIAGVCRRFLVYPSYCVWPASLVTIALNAAFHTEENTAVKGPFNKIFTISRYRFFVYAFTAMFIWFWFPNYIFNALSIFSWISWISPDNTALNAIVGTNNGLGINPFPTFDWNNLLYDGTDPLMVPFFNTINKFAGTIISMFFVVGFWWTNTYNTAYLPINSPRVFDHFGKAYNISRAIDSRGLYDADKYHAYSPAFLTAGYLVVYFFFFAIYSATISYSILYHRHEIMMGFRNLWASIRRDKKGEGEYEYKDIHNRLMSKYNEAPVWWYISILLCAIAFGCAGIAGWQTYTSVGVVFYGVALCVIFVIPIGILKAMTGVEVTLNVLAEFIGGSWVPGNALAMNYFKSFGYVTCATALRFSNDLKLAHYVKIPPKHTFWAQIVATLVSTLVCTGVLNFQINQIPDVCTATQKDHYTCPGINQFFTAAVLWGTIGPHKVFGKGGQYTALLAGFPVGLAVPFVVRFIQKRYPAKKWLRQIHPVVLMYGGILWAPYNLSYLWPAVPIGWFSMVYMKKRYLALWSKYNYALSASFQCGIAIAAVIIFFALQWSSISLSWWGNDVVYQGCEGTPCTLKTIPKGEYFGPRIGQWD